MTANRIKIYGHPMSTCTRKVLVTLAEKGHEAEFVMVDIMKGEAKKPEYVAKHPFAVVPLLEEGDFTLYESRAIIRYLDAAIPGPALSPASLKERAMMEQWISVESSYFSGTAMKIVMQALFAPMSGATPNEDVINKARAELARPLNVLENALTGKTFLVGDQFSLADITYMPYIEYLFAAKSGDLIQERRNVMAWWARISERPTWMKVNGRSAK